MLGLIHSVVRPGAQLTRSITCDPARDKHHPQIHCQLQPCRAEEASAALQSYATVFIHSLDQLHRWTPLPLLQPGVSANRLLLPPVCLY